MAEKDSPILGLDKLQRRTMGNQALQVEILSLFSTEAGRLLRQAVEAEDVETRGDRLSALGALASGIGAERLAYAARRAGREGSGEADLDGVQAALEEVLHAIASDPDAPLPSS